MAHTTNSYSPSDVQRQHTNLIPSRTYIHISKRVGQVLLLVIVLIVADFGHTTPTAMTAAGLDVDINTLYEWTLNNDGEAAVQQLAAIATARGGWGPAPGDIVAYDPEMPHSIRASVRVADLPPDECTDPMMRRHAGDVCKLDFTAQQDLVRYGYTTFVKELDDGRTVARLSVDDLLSVYIEEVGHSWQEYLYETEGRGSGERTRLTSAAASSYWAAGSEYQVKMYILSLDGTWLMLSDTERDEVKTAICADDGYANPMLNPYADTVPDYGPPPDWPNPQGWPTNAPTVDEFQEFCGVAES